MKIVTNDAVYVQKNDIVSLNLFHLSPPTSILMKVFGNGIVVIDETNQNEFVKFDEKEEIEYFKSLDWIIDYNEVKTLTEEETIDFAERIVEEQKTILKQLVLMSEEERANRSDLKNRCDLLEWKFDSLKEAFWLKQEPLPIELPKESNDSKEYAQEKWHQKLFKRKFKKNK